MRDVAAYRFLYDVRLELLSHRTVVAVLRIGPVRVIAQYCGGSLAVDFLARSQRRFGGVSLLDVVSWLSSLAASQGALLRIGFVGVASVS